MVKKKKDKGNGKDKSGEDINATEYMSNVTNFYEKKIIELESRPTHEKIDQKTIDEKKKEVEKLLKNVQSDLVKTGTFKEDLQTIIGKKSLSPSKRLLMKGLTKIKLKKIADKFNLLSPATGMLMFYKHLVEKDKDLQKEYQTFENAEAETEDSMAELVKERKEYRAKKFKDIEQLNSLITKKVKLETEQSKIDSETQEKAYYALDDKIKEIGISIRGKENEVNSAGRLLKIMDNKMLGHEIFLNTLFTAKASYSAVQEPVRLLLENYDSQIKKQSQILSLSEHVGEQGERLQDFRILLNKTTQYGALTAGKLAQNSDKFSAPMYNKETKRLTAGIAEDVSKSDELNSLKHTHANIMEIRKSYHVLDINEGSDETAIKAAYRTKVKKIHPDHNNVEGKKQSHEEKDRDTQKLDELMNAKDICMEYAKNLKKEGSETPETSSFMSKEKQDYSPNKAEQEV